MRNLVLLCLSLILVYSIWVIAITISALNAAIPIMAAQAADNLMLMLMLEVLFAVISLAIMALTSPDWLVFGGGFLVLFEALKELLLRSP